MRLMRAQVSGGLLFVMEIGQLPIFLCNQNKSFFLFLKLGFECLLTHLKVPFFGQVLKNPIINFFVSFITNSCTA